MSNQLQRHYLLCQIYIELFGSENIEKNQLMEYADILSNIANRKKPWTWNYLRSLIKEYNSFSITDELYRAIQILANQLDGQSELQARAREITVMAINGVEPGSVVLGHTIRCLYCQVKFVPVVPHQKYCCYKHKKRYYRMRSKQDVS